VPLAWAALLTVILWAYLRAFVFPLLTKEYRSVWRRRLRGVSTQGTVVGVKVNTDTDPAWARIRMDASDTVVLVPLRQLRMGDRVGIRYHPADPGSAVRLDRTFGALLGLAVFELALVAYQLAVLLYAGWLVYHAVT
jgi:hypothetical protein